MFLHFLLIFAALYILVWNLLAWGVGAIAGRGAIIETYNTVGNVIHLISTVLAVLFVVGVL